jgi:hypothetical protein
MIGLKITTNGHAIPQISRPVRDRDRSFVALAESPRREAGGMLLVLL